MYCFCIPWLSTSTFSTTKRNKQAEVLPDHQKYQSIVYMLAIVPIHSFHPSSRSKYSASQAHLRSSPRRSTPSNCLYDLYREDLNFILALSSLRRAHQRFLLEVRHIYEPLRAATESRLARLDTLEINCRNNNRTPFILRASKVLMCR